MTVAVETIRLEKTYGNRGAIDGITLSIDEGAPIGLVGPNGAGKTTFFSLISGYLNPTRGEVLVYGKHPRASSLRCQVPILPQDANFPKGIVIHKQLTFLAQLNGFNNNQARNAAQDVLEKVGLSNSAHLPIDSLSHGMRRRVAIAQAFLGDPKLIMLDEPTAGLDPTTANNIRSLIRSLADRKTFIVSSHNLSEIQDLCQTILILNKGKLATQSKISDLVSNQNSLTVRLNTDAPANISELFSHVTAISDITTGKKGEHTITISYQGEQPANIEIAVIQTLQKANIEYREITRGQKLEQKVTQITSK